MYSTQYGGSSYHAAPKKNYVSNAILWKPKICRTSFDISILLSVCLAKFVNLISIFLVLCLSSVNILYLLLYAL